MVEECKACGWLVDYGACGCPDGKPRGPIESALACPRCERYGCVCSTAPGINQNPPGDGG